MIYKFKKYIFLSLFITILIPFKSIAQNNGKPVSIIFDSDMGPDYDDVGAITLLHSFADNGEAKILATVPSNRYPGIAEVFDVLNTYFDRPDIPIGIPKGPSVEMRDSQGWSNAITYKYKHDIKSNDDVPSSVDVYRKVLSQQPDNSVTIVTVGFYTNLADLLVSKSDRYSNLSGKQLVEKKVKKLVSMAGKFPRGKEFNVIQDIPASNYVFENWPTKIIFSGFEIGEKIKTGIPLIHNENIQNSPVKDVFKISIPKNPNDKNGRSSWDETAVLIAVKGVEPYYSLVPGKISLNPQGVNSWDPTKEGQFYIVENKTVDFMQSMINKLMQHQPHGGNSR